ncbi:MAG: hypothetical protein ACR2M6_03715 [Vampirovibrionia bacterium]
MAIEKKIVIDVETVKAAGGLDNLKKKLKETNTETKKLKEETKELKKESEDLKDKQKANSTAFKTLDKFTGGLASKFVDLKKKTFDLVKGFGAVRVALAATGIGALILLITSLTQAFKRSEEGQKKFKKILAVLGSVVDNVLDVFANLGEAIIDTFLNPIETLKSFSNSIKTYVLDKITTAIDGFGLMGSAIKKVFTGDFKGAVEDAQQGFSKLVDASPIGVFKDVVDAATESVVKFSTEVLKDARQASQVADKRAKAEILARNLLIERAEAERKIAELREKVANKEKFTADERIKFLKEAGVISEELANKETEVARLKLEAKQVENSLAKSTTEDLNEEAQLKADLINKETQRLKLQKALTAEVTTATREANAEAKKIAAEQKAIEDKKIAEEQTRLDAIQKIRDDFALKQKEKEAESEVEKINLEEQKKLAELEKLKASEEQKLEVLKYYSTLRTEAEEKENNKKEEIEKLRKKQTLADAQGTFNSIAQLAGKDSKIGKAMAIASATISGVEGVQNAYSTAQKSPITTFFPAYPVVQAALAGAVAAKNIAAIKSVSAKGGGSTSVPVASGGGASQPPSFNIVGATETSQLAGAIGGQTQQPVQAYVVSNDVTTAQSLENNIVEGATL